MKVSFCNDPWPHAIIDDFLPADDFQIIKDYVLSRYDLNSVREAIIENHTQTVIYNILAPKVLELKDKYLEQLNYGSKEIPARSKPLIELRICPPGFVYKKIHCDAVEKIMSTVLYITPEQSNGTELYGTRDVESLSDIVTWRENRALIFVGQNNPLIQGTWHNYRNTTNLARATANLILQMA